MGVVDVACLEAPCHGERKEPCWCDSEDGVPLMRDERSQEHQDLWEESLS